MRVASAASEQGDSAAIAAWATPHVTSGDERPSGYPRRIGTRWILRDPEAALAWLASLPAGHDRDDGVMESYRDWMRYAPGGRAEMDPERRSSSAGRSRRSRSTRAGWPRNRPRRRSTLVARFSDEAAAQPDHDGDRAQMGRPGSAKRPRHGSPRPNLPEDVRTRALGSHRGARREALTQPAAARGRLRGAALRVDPLEQRLGRLRRRRTSLRGARAPR